MYPSVGPPMSQHPAAASFYPEIHYVSHGQHQQNQHQRQPSPYTNPTHADFQRFYASNGQGMEMGMMQSSPLTMGMASGNGMQYNQQQMMMTQQQQMMSQQGAMYSAVSPGMQQFSSSPSSGRPGQYTLAMCDPDWKCWYLCTPICLNWCTCRYSVCCRDFTPWEKLHYTYFTCGEMMKFACCPCCVYAETMELGFQESYCVNCACWAFCSCCNCCRVYRMRKSVQKKWNIQESDSRRCCLAVCCTPCAMVQDVREVRIRAGPQRAMMY